MQLCLQSGAGLGAKSCYSVWKQNIHIEKVILLCQFLFSPVNFNITVYILFIRICWQRTQRIFSELCIHKSTGFCTKEVSKGKNSLHTFLQFLWLCFVRLQFLLLFLHAWITRLHSNNMLTLLLQIIHYTPLLDKNNYFRIQHNIRMKLSQLENL